ncbi:MAG: hypothetical protein LBU57_09865, partial [Dysgonamonadaceae bacterium]|nr:hypothetical protein [Dysgonamonadaceae bacterium]
TKKIDLIPIEEVNFVYRNNDINNEVKEFLNWILSEGQVFNHEYGLLNLSEKQLAQILHQ